MVLRVAETWEQFRISCRFREAVAGQDPRSQLCKHPASPGKVCILTDRAKQGKEMCCRMAVQIASRKEFGGWQRNTEDGYGEYLGLVETAKRKVLDGIVFMAEMEAFYRGAGPRGEDLDYGRTADGVYRWWASRDGWQNKRRKCRGKRIDWVKTWKMAFGMRMNQQWKQQERERGIV